MKKRVTRHAAEVASASAARTSSFDAKDEPPLSEMLLALSETTAASDTATVGRESRTPGGSDASNKTKTKNKKRNGKKKKR
eukprot:m.140355 g.140355  ORF g.140355 m.140355 type:complete len:81 (+) comp11523_c0_seq8:275-517(+)